MSTLEQDLSQAMTALADGAPDDLGLLSRVQAGSRRRTRNRRIGLAIGIGAVAAAVAVVTVGPVGLPEAQNRYADPTGFLVDSRDLELRFPLTPSFLPPGLSATPLLEETGHFGSANYILGDNARHQVYLAHQDRAYPADGVPTTVSGKPAAEKCDANQCSLTWQRRPDLWVMVVVSPGTDARGLVHQVAEDLTDTPIVHRPRVVLGLTPAKGCVLSDPHGLSTSMNPVDLPDEEATCPVGASVYTKDEAAQAGYPDAVGERVAMGGYTGWLQERDPVVNETHGDAAVTPKVLHQWVAVLRLTDGRRLVVQTPRTGGWDRTELARFVKAIIVPTR